MRFIGFQLPIRFHLPTAILKILDVSDIVPCLPRTPTGLVRIRFSGFVPDPPLPPASTLYAARCRHADPVAIPTASRTVRNNRRRRVHRRPFAAFPKFEVPWIVGAQFSPMLDFPFSVPRAKKRRFLPDRAFALRWPRDSQVLFAAHALLHGNRIGQSRNLWLESRPSSMALARRARLQQPECGQLDRPVHQVPQPERKRCRF